MAYADANYGSAPTWQGDTFGGPDLDDYAYFAKRHDEYKEPIRRHIESGDPARTSAGWIETCCCGWRSEVMPTRMQAEDRFVDHMFEMDDLENPLI